MVPKNKVEPQKRDCLANVGWDMEQYFKHFFMNIEGIGATFALNVGEVFFNHILQDNRKTYPHCSQHTGFPNWQWSNHFMEYVVYNAEVFAVLFVDV